MTFPFVHFLISLACACAGVKKFLISFDDGDEIWTGLPARDVRPATSDLATAGGIAREGVPVHVVSGVP